MCSFLFGSWRTCMADLKPQLENSWPTRVIPTWRGRLLALAGVNFFYSILVEPCWACWVELLKSTQQGFSKQWNLLNSTQLKKAGVIRDSCSTQQGWSIFSALGGRNSSSWLKVFRTKKCRVISDYTTLAYDNLDNNSVKMCTFLFGQRNDESLH